jgi:hypothetical protein
MNIVVSFLERGRRAVRVRRWRQRDLIDPQSVRAVHVHAIRSRRGSQSPILLSTIAGVVPRRRTTSIVEFRSVPPASKWWAKCADDER